MTAIDTPTRSTMDVWHEARAQRIPAGALFSVDRSYRYLLWRVWDWSLPYLNVIGLNPSTADQLKLDPTCKRCETRAKSLGYGGYVMTNLFAFKSTDPRGLLTVPDPEGIDENNWTLCHIAGQAGMVLAAWGVHGALRNRDKVVVGLLRCHFEMCGREAGLYCIGTTHDGHPRHPLYVSYSAQPQPFEPRS